MKMEVCLYLFVCVCFLHVKKRLCCDKPDAQKNTCEKKCILCATYHDLRQLCGQSIRLIQ